jgi:putative long chain acyl-CoA synthase
MLLTRVRGVVTTSDSPLRGLFEPDDAWLATGDLFRADDDGDLWLVDNVASLIRTDHGFVAAFPIVDALGDIDAVDLAAVYSVPSETGGRLAVAAIALRAGGKLSARDVTRALGIIKPPNRPDIVHVVDEIPVTTWYRPNTAALRADGPPKPGKGVWRLEGDGYVEFRKREKATAAA